MSEQEREALIAKYKDGYRAVADALAGASDQELDARPAPGKWTAREIVHHLADSEMESALRLRRLIALDTPTLQGYDQDEFSRRLHYDRPIHASLDAFRAARSTTGDLIDRMKPGDWQREGVHTESGRYSAETWLQIYAAHAHNHAEQIRRARAAGKG
ncbi:MAG: DinB family protein [Acidobacteria bacterium]|nr:DinB family protein [Acidobacteriota bacterium]MBI3264118.1 DinB family protein [Acidobacteriota bacterium]